MTAIVGAVGSALVVVVLGMLSMSLFLLVVHSCANGLQDHWQTLVEVA